MRNIPFSKIHFNKNLSVIAPNNPVKNALMLDLNIMLIRAGYVDEDICKLKNNLICDGHSLQVKIKALIEKCKKIDKDVYVLIYEEFRDRFSLHTTLSSSDGLLLHTFILQPIDLTIDNAICVYQVTLECKNKDNTITEHTYIDHTNKIEDQNHAFKVYSKKYSKYIYVVLFCTFISMD